MAIIGIGFLVGTVAACIIGWFVHAAYQAFLDHQTALAKSRSLGRARWVRLRMAVVAVALGLLGLLAAFGGMATQSDSGQGNNVPVHTNLP
ncbi:MAG: hypothetical protein H0T78_12305 [Longispora sp.]|nr:hypothetical protein [Longispora sp. (in: high G+C Gram-positive bacteria)]